MVDGRRELALQLFEQAYVSQMEGDIEIAVGLYQKSIELYPTAEAYTFLGWAYSFQGRVDEAITQCKNAILIDPGYGNPYNDIGAYLIGEKKYDEAIPWLEKATASQRYESYHFPWYNLGRAYAAKEMFRKARQCFEKAIEIEPGYQLAREAAAKLKILVQ